MPHKFDPQTAVQCLVTPGSTMRVSEKIWALAGLLAWAFLDQRPARRVNTQETKPRKDKVRRRREADQAGAIVIAFLLEEQLNNLLRDRVTSDEQEVRAIWRLFQLCGGISRSAGGWGYEGLLSELDLGKGDTPASAKSVLEEARYVFRVVDFLCRYQAFYGANGKIEEARYLAQKSRQRASYGERKVAKIWEKYKDAAPYIYGFLPVIRNFKHTKRDANRVIGWLKNFASDQRRLNRCLGKAAFAADLLDTTAVRNVRINDFRGVERITLRLRSFTKTELNHIDDFRAAKTAPIA